MTRIRLIKKLAPVLNGLDVSAVQVGDIIELPDFVADMMIAERWGELIVADYFDDLVLPPFDPTTDPETLND